MTNERNLIKEYDDWLAAQVASGMPAIEHSLVTLGQSFVWMSPDGIKIIFMTGKQMMI
jgi:hypothetical protein